VHTPPKEADMVVLDERTWLELLSPPECWRMLSLAPVGRVGVLVDSAPEIYPVNFVVDAHSIVFRTDPGSKLRGLARSPSVCFEVDGLDLEDRSGWSVLVKGRAIEVTAPDDRRKVANLAIRAWALGEKAHWIRIQPTEVTGRRIYRAEERSNRGIADPAAVGSDRFLG
jgi:uncharacterized protein